MKKITTILLTLAFANSLLAAPPRNPNGINLDPSLNGNIEQGVSAEDAPRMVNIRKAIGTRHQFKRVPVILVNFSDMEFRIPIADIDSMFNGKHYTKSGATGSVQQYFSDQSNGKYVPQFDIYGPVKVSKSCTSYSGVHSLVTEACNLMDDSLDFTLYALENSKQVDLVYILYAGPPASDEGGIDTKWISNPKSLVWPCKWNLETSIQKDGVTISDYEVSSELDGYYSNASYATIAGIGLACHEFSHGLGLTDTYQTSGSKVNIAKNWDIMCYGLYNNEVRTPPNYNAYQKWFMGWITPTLLSAPATVTLPEWGSSHQAYVITSNETLPSNIQSPNPANFYLMENRQRKGWDSYLAGEGMMITRVKYNSSEWRSNNPNANLNDPHLCYVPADGTLITNPDSVLGRQADLFPTATVNSYTPFDSQPITEIQVKANKDICFLYKGGNSTPTDNVTSEEETKDTTRKIWQNGQLYILRNGIRYSVTGERR